MDMTNIDKNTGLPVLPEDHYWQLVKSGGESPFLYGEATRYPRPKNPNILHPFNRPPRFSGPFLLIKKTTLVPRKTFFGREKEPLTSETTVVACGVLMINPLYDSPDAVPVGPGIYVSHWELVTAGNILRTAEYMLYVMKEVEHEEKRRRIRQEAAEKLFGTYPPKSL